MEVWMNMMAALAVGFLIGYFAFMVTEILKTGSKIMTALETSKGRTPLPKCVVDAKIAELVNNTGAEMACNACGDIHVVQIDKDGTKWCYDCQKTQ